VSHESDTDSGGDVREPENSTVDDWLGQNIARDEEVADRAVAESDTPAEAEARFDEEATGEETYRDGHPRPDDADERVQRP